MGIFTPRDWENVRKCNNNFAEIDEFAKKDKCWPALCQDSSEVIENEELSGFLKDLLELVKKVAALIMTILIKYLLFPWSIFFSNKYFLIKQIFSHQTNIFSSNKYFLIKQIFSFQTNIFFSICQDYDSADLADFAQTIMKGCDINRDGKISKKVNLEV